MMVPESFLYAALMIVNAWFVSEDLAFCRMRTIGYRLGQRQQLGAPYFAWRIPFHHRPRNERKRRPADPLRHWMEISAVAIR